jgi:glucose dehydrogenase
LAATAVAAAPSSFVRAASDDAQWLRPAKDFASTRFSSLDQITAANVKQLKLAWSFSTGVDRGHEAAPIVVGATMYIVTLIRTLCMRST